MRRQGTATRLAAAMALLACIFLVTSCTASQQQRAKNDMDDALIAAQIRAKIAAIDPATVSLVKIGVQNRVVTLDGQVHTEQERTKIDDATRSVSGIVRVDDNLVVNAKAPTAKEIGNDLELQARVTAALTAQTGVNALKVRVSAHGGVVELDGSAPTPAVRTVAVQTARDVPGVRRVVDHLRIERH